MSPDKKSSAAGKKSTEAPSFDQRMVELENIAAALEGGDLGLEQALERYKRGVDLLRSCRGELEGFRSQVEELAREGGSTSQPLASDPDFAG
ncbi:MAG: exodeoxyribonuclease VII small subunit [Planctomycetes bacterium]|nr:exodeoxyribonuclease VII small subunit [Planctomycetota bacterium]